MNQPSRDELPILLDVIVPGQIPMPAPVASELEPASHRTDAEWSSLEHELRDAVLKNVQGRIDGVLEQHLRESVAQAVEHAFSGLALELKGRVRDTVREVVTRAVAQELSRLRANRN